MTKTVDVRAAKPRDVHAIAALMTELNHEEGHEVIACADAMKHALFAVNREVNLAALVAVADGVIIGTLLYYPGYDTLSTSYGYHLADIVVTKKKRGVGFGKALIAALAKLALEQEKEWLSLTVLKRNDAAHAFYKALGNDAGECAFLCGGKKRAVAIIILMDAETSSARQCIGNQQCLCVTLNLFPSIKNSYC